MAWRHSGDMQDPLRILERREEPKPKRTCSGCMHLKRVEDPFSGREVLECAKRQPLGERCNRFEEK